MATNHTDSRRELLKEILKGKASVEDLRQLVQVSQLDMSLLTEAEQQVLQGFYVRYERDYALSTKSDQWGERTVDALAGLSKRELPLLAILQIKATHGEPSRHLLNRVDLTEISEAEVTAAFQIFFFPMSKMTNKPEWLQE